LDVSSYPFFLDSTITLFLGRAADAAATDAAPVPDKTTAQSTGPDLLEQLEQQLQQQLRAG